MTIISTLKLSKRFQGVHALTDVDFDLEKGEVHAIVGENGAGKSTFVKVLAGIHQPSSGSYYYNGNPTRFSTPKDALAYIGLVHQDRELIPNFNGYQNLFLGSEILKGGLLDNASMKQQCKELMEKYNLHINLDKTAQELGAGQQEMLTILKILSRHPPVLIFDEPTAPLSMQESEALFALIRDLKTKGFSIIYISHRLPEVLALSDRISVLKDGKKVVTLENKGISEQKLITFMISRNMENQYPKVEKTIGKKYFEVKDFTYLPERLQNISYSIREGEIVGFAGLVGSGRTELHQALFSGAGNAKEALYLGGQILKCTSAKKSIESGMVLIPEDRRGCGVIMQMSIKNNIILPNMKKLTKFGMRQEQKIRSFAKITAEKMAVVMSSTEQPVNTLSGGNQQKIAIGKWLDSKAKVWIFDEPTQGIDVETKSEIYRLLGSFAQSGAAVIFISSDLRELTEICDRIYTMYDRKIVGEFTTPFNTQDILSKMIIGADNE